ncbi:MAG TPA: hypothetical protein VEX87_03735 [Skermanella sp.]|nr:hypothetical protein [Skermanella sp.]
MFFVDPAPIRGKNMTKSVPVRRLATVAVTLCFGTQLFAAEATAAPETPMIAWAETMLDANTADPPNVIGAPDDKGTGISDFHYVWVRDFRTPTSYSNISGILGISNDDLAAADVIAFEQNGPQPASGGGWESSVWFFNDQKMSYAETFDEISAQGTIAANRRAVFRTGTISRDDYGKLFATDAKSGVMSWVLIDVPDDIDVHSPNFSIWVSGTGASPVGRGEGSPDAEAIGILVH